MAAKKTSTKRAKTKAPRKRATRDRVMLYAIHPSDMTSIRDLMERVLSEELRAISRRMSETLAEHVLMHEALDPQNAAHRARLAAYVRSLPSRLGVLGETVDVNFAADQIEQGLDRLRKCQRCAECDDPIKANDVEPVRGRDF